MPRALRRVPFGRGEGEWKVRQHGWSRHRTWRKLHLGIDAATGEIKAALSTPRNVHEKDCLGDLLDQVPGPINQVSGDGGYDYWDCYGVIAKRGARAVLPPRCNGQVHPTDGRVQARNANLERIRMLQGSRRKDLNWGRQQWKKESGYHRRSLVETGIFRLKTIFGERLSARKTVGQDKELLLRCAALNKMTAGGMPDSYAIA